MKIKELLKSAIGVLIVIIFVSSVCYFVGKGCLIVCRRIGMAVMVSDLYAEPRKYGLRVVTTEGKVSELETRRNGYFFQLTDLRKPQWVGVSCEVSVVVFGRYKIKNNDKVRITGRVYYYSADSNSGTYNFYGALSSEYSCVIKVAPYAIR